MVLSNNPLTPEEVEEKLREKLKNLSLEKIEENTKKLAQSSGMPYIRLKGFPITPEALRLIKEDKARAIKAVCFYQSETEIKIGTSLVNNPELDELLKQIEQDTGKKVQVFLISENSLKYALDLYKTLPHLYQPSKKVEITSQDLEKFEKKIKTFRDLNEEVQKASTSDFISLILASAIKSRASDIHIEAEEKDIKVRFRIDGVLVDVASIDKKFWKQIISRLKLLSSLKLNVSDVPQDGRFSIKLPSDKLDIRISCLPTAFGESVVMRLLRSSAVGLKFEDLGFFGEAFEILSKEIQRPNGMIITTGPTGSGKTTTLYAILNKINRPEVKILTLEDPIEYQLPGINQSQIDKSKDYTFAKGLRSLLRQDPDVIMVGEIRDSETAKIAVQAALTGHLVISTLHTNDAAGAIPRFLSLGVEPYLLAPALNVIIAQRLVRRICPECKKEAKLDEELLQRVKKDLSPVAEKQGISLDNLTFYKGEGCSNCQGLGYRGRIGIYEVLKVDSEIEKLISKGDVSEYDIKQAADKQGMVTMVQDGLIKAVKGITTVEEVYRVIE
ncbi:type II/IV secretion system protein [bacterium]|nr:type II/IV secretion system protein [bacterium]